MNGVYIKGMKMPNNKPICVIIDAAGQARQYDLNNDRYVDNELYEAISVPGHGRLIDADALYERAKIRSERFNGCFNDTDNVINALYIEHFPTVIEADKEDGE